MAASQLAYRGFGEGNALDLELIQRFAVTLAIGLLIGMERGWDDQETRETPRMLYTYLCNSYLWRKSR